ncbi:MAG: class I SAM-dependent methyltransferase, partial [Actinobacteria bacterium]
MPVTLGNAAAAAAHLAAGDLALDVGGGRGDHAAVWAQRGIVSVVADPSPGMVAMAGGLPGVHAVLARAQSLPFRSHCFGLVYFHLSIHYGAVEPSLAEAARVMSAGGRIEIWTLGPRHHASSNLARWFPRVAEIDAERFPHPERIVAGLHALGLHAVV